MADLFRGEDNIACGFVSSPTGEVLLSEDGVVRFLFHTRGGGPRRIGSIESRDEPACTVQKALLGSFSC